MAGVFVLAICAIALREHHRIAMIDDWRVLHGMFTQPLGQWLFGSQNGHRVPGTFLLLLVDYYLLNGQGRLLVVASLVCAGCTGIVLWRCLRLERDLPPGLGAALLAVVVLLLFWSNGLYNFLWGICQGNLLATLWLVVALWAGIRFGRGDAAGRRDPRLLAVAAFAALGATFGLGEGIVAWAALLVLAATGRFGWRAFGSLVAGTALSLALYTAGEVTDPAHRVSLGHSVGYLLSNPLRVSSVAAAFLGEPVQFAARGMGVEAPAVGIAAGAAGVALFAAFALPRLLGRTRSRPLDQLALGLMGAGLAVTVLVCLARLPYFHRAAPLLHVRYVNWSTLFWMGAVCALPGLIGRPARTARGSTALILLCLATVVALLPGFAFSLEEHRQRRDAVANAALPVLLGVYDEAYVQTLVFKKLELLGPVSERLRRDGANLFGDPRRELPGTLLGDRFEILPPGRCPGFMTLASRPGSGGERNRLAGGWLWEAPGIEPAHIVIADAAGVIRGLGNLNRSASPRPDGRRGVRWTGFLPDFDPTGRYAAYAVLADGHRACRLEGTPPAPGRG